MARKVGQQNRSGFAIVLEEDHVQEVEEGLMRALGGLIREVAEDAEHTAKSDHWYHNRTGNNEAMTHANPVAADSGYGVSWEIGSYTHYAGYLEDRQSYLLVALERALIAFEQRATAAVRRELNRV